MLSFKFFMHKNIKMCVCCNKNTECANINNIDLTRPTAAVIVQRFTDIERFTCCVGCFVVTVGYFQFMNDPAELATNTHLLRVSKVSS